MAKRSPSYPSVSLPEAIERVHEFFHAWGQQDAGFEESLKQWGYTPRSDVGRRLVASMTSYGLLEKTGPNRSNQRLRINKSVLASLFDARAASDERSDMILQMALKPDIYRRVWERWGSDLPDDARFQRYLVNELDFNPRAISRFARCYADTIGLARQHGLARGEDDKEIALDFEDDELLHNVSAGARRDDRDDTDLDFEEASEARDEQSQMYLFANEDIDIELKSGEDEELLSPPREAVDDDHIDFDFSSVEDDEPEVDNFARLARAFEVQALASGAKARELGRYTLRDDCKVAIYADGAIDREALEELFTRLLADLLLGAFDTEDDDS